MDEPTPTDTSPEAVRRLLRLTRVEGHETREVVATRTYPAAPEDVWDAVTDAERIPRWFLPVSGDLRPGGRYQLEGNAGGTVLACEPPRHLALTWEIPGETTRVEVDVTPTAGGATLELRHSGHDDDAKWAEFGPGAVGLGWELALLGLARHLAGGQARPDDPVAWMTSGEGRALLTRSSEAWREAAVAAGEDPDAARAAADRCLVAYTGVPPADA